MAKTADLCGAVTQVLDEMIGRGSKRLPDRTVAVPDWRGAAAVSPEVGAAFDALLESARAVGLKLSKIPADAFPFARVQRLLLTIAEVEGAIVHHQALRERPDGFSPEFASLLAWGAGTGAGRYDAAMKELAAIKASTRASLDRFDAVLLPGTPHTAFAFDTGVPADQAVFATLASCLGDPATVFPIGMSSDGLPISAQVMAKNGDLCLAIAAELSVQCGSSPPDTFVDSPVM